MNRLSEGFQKLMRTKWNQKVISHRCKGCKIQSGGKNALLGEAHCSFNFYYIVNPKNPCTYMKWRDAIITTRRKRPINVTVVA